MSGFDRALARAARGSWPNTAMLALPPEGGDGGAALSLAAALLSGHEPDGCSRCRRVGEGIHPDVQTLDRGTALITVDDVRALRRDAFVAPLEASRKVYLIRHSQNMNTAAQNAALKLLEEPPEGVYFILLCENTSAMLPTVLSRCMLLRLDGGDAGGEDEEAAGLASAFIHALAEGEELELFRFCQSCEKLKRAQLDAFFTASLSKLREALLVSCGAGELSDGGGDSLALVGLSTAQLIKITEIIKRRRLLNRGNVGAAQLCGTIAAQYYMEN